MESMWNMGDMGGNLWQNWHYPREIPVLVGISFLATTASVLVKNREDRVVLYAAL
jgi:hypothetical protein